MIVATPFDQSTQVQAAVAALFDVAVSVQVTDPKALHPALMDSEQSAVANAVPARQREFAAGRAAARAAMVDLGLTPVAVLAGSDRAPIWPTDVVGSISHTDGLCVAVLCHSAGAQSLGVDIEEATPLDQALSLIICTEVEQKRIAGPDASQLAKLIFSAKEAAYKAQYPLTGLLFGFDHFDVKIDESNQAFIVTFLKPAPPFRVGDTLPGRFARVAGQLVTAVTIRQKLPKGD